MPAAAVRPAPTSRTAPPAPAVPVGSFRPGQLSGVAAASARSAWAAGAITVCGHNLIVDWNGSAWQQVRRPSPPDQGVLAAVAATSASSAWAAGSAASSTILSTTLIEHWNGNTWTRLADRHRS